jgi:hypothetical protein
MATNVDVSELGLSLWSGGLLRGMYGKVYPESVLLRRSLLQHPEACRPLDLGKKRLLWEVQPRKCQNVYRPFGRSSELRANFPLEFFGYQEAMRRTMPNC